MVIISRSLIEAGWAGNQGNGKGEEDGDEHGWNGLHPFMRNSVPQGITPVRNSPHGTFRVARRRKCIAGAALTALAVRLRAWGPCSTRQAAVSTRRRGRLWKVGSSRVDPVEFAGQFSRFERSRI